MPQNIRFEAFFYLDSPLSLNRVQGPSNFVLTKANGGPLEKLGFIGVLVLCAGFIGTKNLSAEMISVSVRDKSMTFSGEITLNSLTLWHHALKRAVAIERRNNPLGLYQLRKEGRRLFAERINAFPTARSNNYLKYSSQEDLTLLQNIVKEMFLLGIDKMSINSPGGDFEVALQIASVLEYLNQTIGFEIYVPQNSRCDSACTFIVSHVSLVRLHESSRLMYHLIKKQRSFMRSPTPVCLNGRNSCPKDIPRISAAYQIFFSWLDRLPEMLKQLVLTGEDIDVSPLWAQELGVSNQIVHP